MTSRERVHRAVHFLGPDRLPHLLPDGGDNDILWLWMPQPPDRQPWTPTGDGHDRRVDAWGTVWERAGNTCGEAVEWPVADIRRQADYALPDFTDPALYAAAREAIGAEGAAANPRYCLGVMPLAGLYATAHSLMGLENLFLALHDAPQDLAAFLGRLAAAQRDCLRALADAGCDGVMGYDDWGLQDRPMLSPAAVAGFFLPHYRATWGLAHELGMDVWLHSCGHIVALLDMFIEAGLNVVQMDQQENMGLEELGRRFGGRLAFWCPVDIQATMARGTPEDVRAYVARMVAALGSHRGGLISMAYSSPESVGHTPENLAAMCAAFRELGTCAA
jgi:hypothetical protein